jgi:hypothetical protein
MFSLRWLDTWTPGGSCGHDPDLSGCSTLRSRVGDMTVDGVCLAWGAADLGAGLRDRSVPCRVRVLLWLLA